MKRHEVFNKFLALIFLVSLTFTSFGATFINGFSNPVSKNYFEEVEEAELKTNKNTESKTEFEIDGDDSPPSFIISKYNFNFFNPSFSKVLEIKQLGEFNSTKEQLYILYCSLKLHFS